MKNRWLLGVALLVIGVIIEVAGDRTYWFGMRQPRLSVQDCEAVQVLAPYVAWIVTLNKDGSVLMQRGTGQAIGGAGFGEIDRSGPACHLPAGSLDFSQICHELLSKRTLDTAKVSGIWNYDDVYYDLSFFPSEKVQTERFDPVMRSRYLYYHTGGAVSPAQGNKLFNSVRAIAKEQERWPQAFEDDWPYPPIPWTHNLGVPNGLRVIITPAQ